MLRYRLANGPLYSLSTTMVKALYPSDEAGHVVRFWNSKGLLFTSSVGGLCYVLTGERESWEGCRLVADGEEFTGEDIPRWGAEHLPKSLAIAAEIRRQNGAQSPVGRSIDEIATRSGSEAPGSYQPAADGEPGAPTGKASS